MTCTRNGCYNIQCYVCSKTCSYDHFDDRSRGGRAGNCPLFDNSTERHEQEVKQAEKIALDKVRAEHPEYTEEDLRIKISEKVKQDEERRKGPNGRPPPPFGVYGPNGFPLPFVIPPPGYVNGAPVQGIPQLAPGANGHRPPVYNHVGAAHNHFGFPENDLAGLFGPLRDPIMRLHPLAPPGPQHPQQNFVRPEQLGLQEQRAPAVQNLQVPLPLRNPAMAGRPGAAQRQIGALQAQLNQIPAAAPVVPVQQQAHRRRR